METYRQFLQFNNVSYIDILHHPFKPTKKMEISFYTKLDDKLTVTANTVSNSTASEDLPKQYSSIGYQLKSSYFTFYHKLHTHKPSHYLLKSHVPALKNFEISAKVHKKRTIDLVSSSIHLKYFNNFSTLQLRFVTNESKNLIFKMHFLPTKFFSISGLINGDLSKAKFSNIEGLLGLYYNHWGIFLHQKYANILSNSNEIIHKLILATSYQANPKLNFACELVAKGKGNLSDNLDEYFKFGVTYQPNSTSQIKAKINDKYNISLFGDVKVNSNICFRMRSIIKMEDIIRKKVKGENAINFHYGVYFYF